MSNPVLEELQSRAARVDLLAGKKKAAIETAQSILAVAQKENRTLSTDEQTAFDTAEKEVNSIVATIEAEQRGAKLAAMSNIPTDTGVPGVTGPAVRSQVTVHDRWTESESLFGSPAPATSETTKQRKERLMVGFGDQLMAIKNAELSIRSGTSNRVDHRLLELQNRYEKRAGAAGASEQVPADGGFLVQPDFSDQLLSIAHDTGLVYPLCRKIPISEWTNAIKIPGMAEYSRVDGQRWGGVQMFWENEAQALTGAKPAYRLVELVLKKLTGLYYATNELLQDARALGGVATQAFGEEMAFKLDDGVIRGTGAGQMQGVLKSPALISVAKDTGQMAATVTWGNIKKMWARMWTRSKQNSVWFINQDVEPQLMSMVQEGGIAGIPVYLPPGVGGSVFGGATAQPYGQLLGRPVVEIEQCDTLGSQGDIMLLDMSQHLMIDKGDMQTAVSAHVRFLSDEQTFRWIMRTDAQSSWFQTLTPYKGSNSYSPYVVLDAR